MRQPSKHSKVAQRILSLAVTVFFSLNSTLWAAPVDGSSIVSAFSSEISAQNLIDKIVIPQELGSIQDRFLSNGSGSERNAPIVVHIQDAHASQEAQQNIHALIDYLNQEYGFSLVLLEGASDELNPGALQVFKKAEQNKKFVEELMKQGDVNGAESFLISNAYKNPSGIKAFGLESREAYVQDLKQFRSIWPETEKGRAFVDTLVQLTDRASSRHVNPELRTFLKEWVHFKEFRQDLNSYFNTIDKAAARFLELDLHDPRNQREWPVLLRIFKLKEIEPKLNIAQAKAEWEQAKAKLAALGADQNIIAQVEGRLLNREEPVTALKNSTRSLLETLLDSVHEQGFSFRDYPQLALLVGNAILRYEVDSEQVFNELERLNSQIIARLAETEEEKQVVELLRLSFLLKDLFNLELSRDYYLELKNGKAKFTPEELMNRLRQIEPTSEVPSEAELKSLSDLYFECLKSYEFAIEREHAFFDNLRKALRESKENKAITVAGGFHTFGFTNQLKENRISYLTISPRISSFDDVEKEEKAYINSLLQPVPKSLSGSLRTKDGVLIKSRESYTGNLRFLQLRVTGAAHRSLADPRNAALELNPDVLEALGIRIEANGDEKYLIDTIAHNGKAELERRMRILSRTDGNGAVSFVLDARNAEWRRLDPAQQFEFRRMDDPSKVIAKVTTGPISDLNLTGFGTKVQAKAPALVERSELRQEGITRRQFLRENIGRAIGLAAANAFPITGLIGCGSSVPIAVQSWNLSTVRGANGQPVVVRTWATPGAIVKNPVQTLSTDLKIPGATQIDVGYSLVQQSAAGLTISNVDPNSLQEVGEFGKSLITSMQLVGATVPSAIKIKVTDQKLRQDLADGVDYAQVDKNTPAFFFKVDGSIQDFLAALGKIKDWYPDFQMDGGSLEFTFVIEDVTDSAAFVNSFLSRFNLSPQSPQQLIDSAATQFAHDFIDLFAAGRVLGQELQLNRSGILRVSLYGTNIQHEFNLAPNDGQGLVWTAPSLAELPNINQVLPNLTDGTINAYTFIPEDLQAAVTFEQILDHQKWTINVNNIPNVNNRTVIIGVTAPGTVPGSWYPLQNLFQAFKLKNVKRLKLEYKTGVGEDLGGTGEVAAVAYFNPDPARPDDWILVGPAIQNFISEGGAEAGWRLANGQAPGISRFFIVPEPMTDANGQPMVMEIETAYQSAVPSPVLFGLRSELRENQTPYIPLRRAGRWVGAALKVLMLFGFAGVLGSACDVAVPVTPPVVPSASETPGLSDIIDIDYSQTNARMANLSAVNIPDGARIELLDPQGAYRLTAALGGGGFVFGTKPGQPLADFENIKFQFETTANQVTILVKDIENHPTGPVTIFQRSYPVNNPKQVDLLTMLGGELPNNTSANEVVIIVPGGETITLYVNANTVANKDELALIPQPVTPATIATLTDHPTENTVDLSSQDVRVFKGNAGIGNFTVPGEVELTVAASEMAGAQNNTTAADITFFKPNGIIDLHTLAAGNNTLIIKNMLTENVLPSVNAADDSGHIVAGTTIGLDLSTANGTGDFTVAELISVLEPHINTRRVKYFGWGLTAGGVFARQSTPGDPITAVPQIPNRNAQAVIKTSTNNAQPPDLMIDVPLPNDNNPSTANMLGNSLLAVNANVKLTAQPNVYKIDPVLPLVAGSRVAVSPTGNNATDNDLLGSTVSIQVPADVAELSLTVEFKRIGVSTLQTATDIAIPISSNQVRFDESIIRYALTAAGVTDIEEVVRTNIQGRVVQPNDTADKHTFFVTATNVGNFPTVKVPVTQNIFTMPPDVKNTGGMVPSLILFNNATGSLNFTSYDGDAAHVKSRAVIDGFGGQSINFDLGADSANGFSVAIRAGQDINNDNNLTFVPFTIELINPALPDGDPAKITRKIVYAPGVAGPEPTAGTPDASVFTFTSEDVPDNFNFRDLEFKVFTTQELFNLANTGVFIDANHPWVVEFYGHRMGVLAQSELRAEAAELLDFTGVEAARRLSVVSNVLGIGSQIPPRSELRIMITRRSAAKVVGAALAGFFIAGPGCAINWMQNAAMPVPITGTPTERILKSAQAYFRFAQLERIPLDRLVPGQTIDTTSPTVIGLYLIYLSLIASGKITADYLTPATARGEILYVLGKLNKFLDRYGPLNLFSTKFKILTQKDLTVNTQVGDLIPVVGADGQEASFHDNGNLLVALAVAAGNLSDDHEIWQQANAVIDRQRLGFASMVDSATGLYWGVIDRFLPQTTNEQFRIDRFINESLIAVLLSRALNSSSIPESVLVNLTTEANARVTKPLALDGNTIPIITDGPGHLGFTNGFIGLVASDPVFQNSVIDIANRNISRALVRLASEINTGGLPAPTNDENNQFGSFGILGRDYGDFDPEDGDAVHSVYPLILALNRLTDESEREKALVLIEKGLNRIDPILHDLANVQFIGDSFNSVNNQSVKSVLGINEGMKLLAFLPQTDALSRFLNKRNARDAFNSEIAAVQSSRLGGIFVPEIGPSSRARSELRAARPNGSRQILTEIPGAQNLVLSGEVVQKVLSLITAFYNENTRGSIVFEHKNERGEFEYDSSDFASVFAQQGLGGVWDSIKKITDKQKVSDERSWLVSIVENETEDDLLVRLFLPIEVSREQLPDGAYALTIFNDDQAAPVEPAFLLTDGAFAEDLLRIAKALAQSGKDYQEIRSEIEQRIREHQTHVLAVETAAQLAPRSELRRTTILDVTRLALDILPSAFAAEDVSVFNQALGDLGLAVASAPVSFADLQLSAAQRNLLADSAQFASSVKAQQVHILAGMPDDIGVLVASKRFDLSTIAAGFGYKLVVQIPGATEAQVAAVRSELRAELDSIASSIGANTPDQNTIVVGSVPQDARSIARELARNGYLPSVRSELRDHTAILASNDVLSAVTQGAGVFLIADDISNDVVSRANLSYEIWQLVAGLDQQAGRFMNRIVSATELIARTLETVRSELRAIARSA